MTNDLGKYEHIFDDITPFEGTAPAGIEINFVGTVFDVSLQIDPPASQTELTEPPPARHLKTRRPQLSDGEFYFEMIDVVEAVRAARGSFTMIELGGGYGPRCGWANSVLNLLNPLPRRFVLVEPEPYLLHSARRHFSNNGIEPSEHWLVPVAVTTEGRPTLILTGKARAGLARLYGTVLIDGIIKMLTDRDAVEAGLRNLLGYMRIGLNMAEPGADADNDVAVVSALALKDILAPLDRVDLMDIDIQGDEATVLPDTMDMLARKVRRIHLGTHHMDRHGGPQLHHDMVRLFTDAGWEIVFAFTPNTRHKTQWGNFDTPSDGILTVVNPRLA